MECCLVLQLTASLLPPRSMIRAKRIRSPTVEHSVLGCLLLPYDILLMLIK
jgi:hypothetical protein